MKKKILSTIMFVILLTSNIIAQDTTVSLSDFVKKLNSTANPQILDARSPEEYAQNHIKGAINVNLKDSVATIKIIATLDSKRPAFTYSINNGRSSVLAKKLRAKGFEHVYELPGGLANWVGSGNPLESFNKKGLAITSEQFRQLAQSKELVLVDFGSKYCGACRKLSPILDSVENKYISNLRVLRIEMYDNPELVKDQKITSLPTLVLYKNGEIVWNNNGYITCNQLLTVIQSKTKLTAIKN